MTHPGDEILNDLADGLLGPEERAVWDPHLEECAECKSTLASIQALSRGAALLTEGPVDPPDLWSGIEAGIRASSRPPIDDITRRRLLRAEVSAGGGSPTTRWRRNALRAAAAVILIAVSSGITYLAVRPSPGFPGGSPAIATDPSIVEGDGVRFAGTEWGAMADAYGPTIQELHLILDEGRDRMDPETLAVVEQALRVIDQAIQDAVTALEANPGNPIVLRSLNGIYDSKVQLLRQAAGLARST